MDPRYRALGILCVAEDHWDGAEPGMGAPGPMSKFIATVEGGEVLVRGWDHCGTMAPPANGGFR